MRFNWIKWAWIIGFSLVLPGTLIYLSFWWFSTFVIPTLTVPLSELMAKPVLDIVVAACFFFGAPSLIILALFSFAIGVRVLID